MYLDPIGEAAERALLADLLAEIASRSHSTGLKHHVDSLMQKLEAGDFRSLVEADPPSHDDDAETIFLWYQANALFKKHAGLDTGIDRRSVAYAKFCESERCCQRINNRLKLDLPFKGSVEAVILTAQRKMASILGDFPPLEELRFTFGPGATSNTKARESNARHKLSADLVCSSNLYPTLASWLCHVPGLRMTSQEKIWEECVSFSEGVLEFVPKDARTDRAIVKEPLLNGLFQKGVGDYMAKRLRLAGVDISDQSLNQKLARSGSLDGEYATIDLSMASDTVSVEHARLFLPDPWYSRLSEIRTSRVRVRGHNNASETHILEKFSSMGNAFTFPLETAIFYSLAWACKKLTGAHGAVNAYGDDIVIPSAAAALLFEVLDSLGFIVNRDKSYWTGPFRESCGADYVLGTDVRPVYIRDTVLHKDLFTLHNEFTRKGEPGLAAVALKYIPEPLRIWGPNGYGDGHLVGSWVGVRPNREQRRAGYGGVYFESYVEKPPMSKRRLRNDKCLPAYSIYVSAASVWRGRTLRPADATAPNYRVRATTYDVVEPGAPRMRGEPLPSSCYITRGVAGYSKTSIYTFKDSVF